MVIKKKLAKKEFYEVKSAITSNKMVLYASSPQELENKVITLDLTRSLRGKSLQLRLKVTNENGTLVGNPASLELIGSYIRRMIRGGIDYVEDSFTVECKDGKGIVKPFMITRNKVSRSIRNEIRLTARKHLETHFKSRSLKEIFTEIMTNKIQKELSLKIKKIYPLALCEIRVFSVVQEQKSHTPSQKETASESKEENKA